ncbi:MAG: CD1247 N-terminal domain-containing protein [Christensenellales bacterium]
MENIEKVAYLRGMLEGMKFDADSDMGKIVLKLIDIVDDLAHDLTDAEERADVMADYIDELDHDLGEVEEYVYGDDCDCCDDDDCDCCCDDDDDDDLYELECPNCGDKIYITEDMLNGSIGA